jgi:uncharacterized membrane protein YhaH (DUF805 family)
MDWYFKAFRNFANFGDRARRTEYWMFTLVNVVVAFLLGIVDGIAGFGHGAGIGLLGGIYSLVVFIPSLAVTVRRLHDTNRSGWWVLVGIIPILGWLALLYFLVSEGQRGGNEYGLDPKDA